MLASEGNSALTDTVAGRSGPSHRFASAFWMGLNIAAGIGAVLSGMNPVLVMLVVMAFMSPALLDLIAGPRDMASDGSEVWVVFSWLGLSFVAIWASGAAVSPLSILLALGPLHAFSVGRFRLGVEASVFAAFGFLGITALERLGYGSGDKSWLGIVPSLWVLISVLQIGIFIAAARANLKLTQAQQNTLRHWQETLWGVPVMVLSLDTEGRIRSWVGNRDILGAPAEFTLTRSGVADIFSNSDEIRCVDAAPIVLQSAWTDTKPLEARLLRALGGYRMVLSPVSPALKEMEILQAEMQAAKLAYEGQAKWVASLGHELRNMLNPVGGYSDLILSERAGPIGGPYKEFARSIKQGAEHLTMLVDDLMTATKSRAGHLKLTPEILTLRQEIEDAIKLSSWQAEGNKVSLLLTDGPDYTIFADRKSLRQILINLMSNAIKYSPANGKVTISVVRDGDHACIEVRDQGEGMSEADLARIGEAFFQGENAKGRTGTGLGLSIVKMLSEAMDGRFELQSVLKEGTRAKVWLPKRSAEAEPEPDRSKEAEAS